MTIPSLLIIRRNFLPPLTLAVNLVGMAMQATRPLAVRCLVLDPTNKTMPPFHSLLRAMWGLDVIAVVAAGSDVQTTCIAKTVPNNPVGIRFFKARDYPQSDT
jgi:hypothetical protein